MKVFVWGIQKKFLNQLNDFIIDKKLSDDINDKKIN